MADKIEKSIEYALHVYDIFWDYYKKTLDERNQILNNYIIFVGIPISIVGILAEKIKCNFEENYILVCLFLCIIFTLGIVIYNTYIIESFVSQRYLQQINHITEYLINNFNSSYQNVFKETYELNNVFLDKKYSQKQRINKSFIIVIINTIIMISIFLLLFKNGLMLDLIVLSIIISVTGHYSIFFYYKRNIKI